MVEDRRGGVRRGERIRKKEKTDKQEEATDRRNKREMTGKDKRIDEGQRKKRMGGRGGGTEEAQLMIRSRYVQNIHP